MLRQVAQMISISYVAAFDPYHSIFRILSLLGHLPTKSYDADVVRILDFYLCSPFLVADFRSANDIAGQRKLQNQVKKEYPAAAQYGVTPDSQALYDRMRPSQMAALNSLASNGLIDAEAFKRRVILRTAKAAPEPIEIAVRDYALKHGMLLELMESYASLPVAGPNGIKARSGLQEFRYDYV
jgi:hypothetical protein